MNKEIYCKNYGLSSKMWNKGWGVRFVERGGSELRRSFLYFILKTTMKQMFNIVKFTLRITKLLKKKRECRNNQTNKQIIVKSFVNF